MLLSGVHLTVRGDGDGVALARRFKVSMVSPGGGQCIISKLYSGRLGVALCCDTHYEFYHIFTRGIHLGSMCLIRESEERRALVSQTIDRLCDWVLLCWRHKKELEQQKFICEEIIHGSFTSIL